MPVPSYKRPYGNIGYNSHGSHGNLGNNGSKGASRSEVSWKHPRDVLADY